jgi:hypothetical protein
MAESISLHVEVEDDGIIVTLPGTTFRVIYKKPQETAGLIAFGFRGDKDAGLSQVDFLARVSRVAPRHHEALDVARSVVSSP